MKRIFKKKVSKKKLKKSEMIRMLTYLHFILENGVIEEEWIISAPFQVEQKVHVDFNSATGFSGLPPEWEALLATSGIEKAQVVEHHQAMLDILEFVERQATQHIPEEEDEVFQFLN